MSTSHITIHTDKQNMPEFIITNFPTFTCLEIKAGPSKVNFHLAAGVSLADILSAVCQAEVEKVG